MVADLIEQAEEKAEDFVNCLKRPPLGLRGIYKQYCERLASKLVRPGLLKSPQLDRARRCLKWLCVARVMELGQLGMALSSWPPREDFKLHDNFQDGVEGPIRKCLGSLIDIRTVGKSTLDGPDEKKSKSPETVRVVTLIHDSLRLFLLESDATPGSTVARFSFTMQEAYLGTAISCLSYLNSNNHAHKYSTIDYDQNDVESRLLMFAGNTWLECASKSGTAGATSIKLLKLISLHFVTSCAIALSTFHGLPYKLGEMALEDTGPLSKIDIRNFASCIFTFAETLAKEVPTLLEAEQRVQQLSMLLTASDAQQFQCKTEHIHEGRRILLFMRRQGVPLQYYDLVSTFNLKESTSKLLIPIRACEYGLRELQAQFSNLTSITPHIKYCRAITDSIHKCAVEANQDVLFEELNDRFMVPCLAAPYRTLELFMGLAALNNIPWTAFHDWELYRRPRKDGYNMKYSNMAYDSVPRKISILSGDFLIKSVVHSGRMPSEAVAYLERFPILFVSTMLFGVLGWVYTTIALLCTGVAYLSYVYSHGDDSNAIASLILALPARLFPLDPSAYSVQRVLISTVLASTKHFVPTLSWADILRVLIIAESLRTYHRRLAFAWTVEDLRVHPSLLRELPQISIPGKNPPDLALLSPLAMYSFRSRFLRLVEPCLVLLAPCIFGSWLPRFYLYLGLFRVGYAIGAEQQAVLYAFTRFWISFVAVFARMVVRLCDMPAPREISVFHLLLFACFIGYDVHSRDSRLLSAIRINMVHAVAAALHVESSLLLSQTLNVWTMIHLSALLVFTIDFLQRAVLDPSGMIEAVSSLFTGMYLQRINEAEQALEVQKNRLRKELTELATMAT